MVIKYLRSKMCVNKRFQCFLLNPLPPQLFVQIYWQQLSVIESLTDSLCYFMAASIIVRGSRSDLKESSTLTASE